MSLLGVHVADGKRKGIDLILAAKPAVVVMCDQNLIADAKKAGAVTAFRTKLADKHIADDNGDNPHGLLDLSIDKMSEMAVRWIDAQLPIWDKNPGADFYFLNNELDAGTIENTQKLNAFHLAAMQYADQKGKKLGIFNFSTGCPSDDAGLTAEQRWTELLPAVHYATAHGHVIVLHIHAVDKGPLSETGEDIAYRHERMFRFFEDNGVNPLPKVIFGELSNGVGGVEPDLASYVAQITAWDTHVMASKYRNQILGAALYGYNAKETIATAASRIADWIAANPTPIDPVVPPSPVETWDKVVVLVSQEVHQSVYNTVTSQFGYPTRTEVAFSAHAAFAPAMNTRSHKVIVVNAAAWGGEEKLLAWAKAQFGKLPDMVEYRTV